MKKKLLIAGIVVLMGFLMTACGDSSSDQNEAATNTIQPYVLSDEEEGIVNLVSPNSEGSITQYSVDETFKRVSVGYDYYEKGKLVAENCDESDADFTYEGGAQATSGMIYTNIDNDFSKITIRGDGSEGEEANTIGSNDPLSNEDQTLDDMSGISSCAIESPVSIEKDKKIYIWAAIGDNDDELEVGDVSSLMKDKKLLSSYDKAFVFYAVFK